MAPDNHEIMKTADGRTIPVRKRPVADKQTYDVVQLVKTLIQALPNDEDLGKAVRKLFNPEQ